MDMKRRFELWDSEGEEWYRSLAFRRYASHERNQGEFRVKMDIFFFDGHLRIVDYLDWEQAVEIFFEYMESSAKKKVKYVACRLKGSRCGGFNCYRIIKEKGKDHFIGGSE